MKINDVTEEQMDNIYAALESTGQGNLAREICPPRYLHRREMRIIAAMFRNGASRKQLAEKFGYNRRSISRIRKLYDEGKIGEAPTNVTMGWS